MPTGPVVSLRVLGPLVVEGPGGRLDLTSRRHRTVLAALAVDAGHVVPADVVRARVWGDDADGSATTLHAVVSRLRGRLRELTADPVVVTEPAGYRLATDACEVDALVVGDRITRARRLLAEGAVDRAHETAATALRLWRGRPYADVPGDFADREADRLTEQRLVCHELLAESGLALGRHETLLDTLPGLLDEHPLRESLHRALMLALYRAGRQADALAVYDRARRLLADELGIDPGPDLQRLWEQILRQDPDLAAPGRAAPPPLPDPRPSRATPATRRPEAFVVGRDRELGVVSSLVEEALAGRAAFGCVVGEPGIGKSHLVAALLDDVAARPAAPLVVTGSCWEDDRTSTLWPWEQALTALVEHVGTDRAVAALSATPGGAETLGLLVPALAEAGGAAGPGTTSDPDRARLRLFDAVARLLQQVAVERPVVVVLEDLHAADEESVALLRYLARSRRTLGVCVLTTTRDVDHGAAVEVQAAVGRGGGTVLALTGLDEADVARLVEHHLGSDLRVGVAAALRERTDGNPFYLVELTRLLAQERVAGGRADVPVPRSVSAVVESRLRGLAEEDRDVLGAAAVIGRDLDLPLLEEVLGRTADDLAAVLDRAAAAGLLVDAGPGAQRFSHALVREVLEAGVGPVRRATWHAQVAEALVARHGDVDHPDRHAARIAHHHLSAGAVGDASAAVRWALAAAAVSERRTALADAERLLRAALEAVRRLPPTVGEPLELDTRIRLAALLSRQLGYDHADVAEQRRRSVELVARCGSAEQLLAGLWGAWGSALVQGALTEADVLLDDLSAAADATAEPWLRVAVAQATGQVRLLQGRLEEARASLEHGVALVDDLPPAPLDLMVQDPAAALRGWLTVVLTAMDAPEAEATARSARRVLERVDHPYTTVYVELLLAWCAVWRDDPAEARVAGHRAVDTARTAGFEQFTVFGRPPSAWALGHEPGSLDEALRCSAEVTARYVDPAHHMFGTLISSVHADLLLRADRAADALGTLDRAIATAYDSGELLVLAHLHRRRAAALDALGRTVDADTARAEGRRVALDQGARLWAT